MKQRGPSRSAFCRGSSGETHEMTDENRRLKPYVRKDGTRVLLANGCAICDRKTKAIRYRSQAFELKVRRIIGVSK